jgi:hypothetical protein
MARPGLPWPGPVAEFDRDGDGRLQYNEFVRMVGKNS